MCLYSTSRFAALSDPYVPCAATVEPMGEPNGTPNCPKLMTPAACRGGGAQLSLLCAPAAAAAAAEPPMVVAALAAVAAAAAAA